MPKVTVNGKVIAQSEDTIVVEGNHYFPPDSLLEGAFEPTDLHTTCPWKGQASYYDIVVDGERLGNAAWYYPQPKDAAAEIKDFVAFYKNKVSIEA